MIKRIFNKVKQDAWVLKYIIPTIYFNFHYLPFKQAIRLPVFLRKPKLLTLKGRVIIQTGGGKAWHDKAWSIRCVNLSIKGYYVSE